MAREHVTFRMKPEGYQRIRDLAEKYDLPITSVIRAMLSVAFNHIDEVNRTLAALSKENL